MSSRPATRKFTPEVLEAIPQWLEGGATPRDIAEALDTSVSSLRVTCSRAGVSLRRSGELPAPDLEVQLRRLLSASVHGRLSEEARRRGVRPTTLALEMLESIADEDLFAAVLGDYDDPAMPGVAGGACSSA